MTGDSGRGAKIGHLQSEWAVTFGRNDRSRSNGISGQLRPEYAHEHGALELYWMEVLSTLRTEVLTSVLLWVNRVHDKVIASLVIVILATQIYRRRWRQFCLLLIMGPGAMLLNLLAKNVFQRPRPQVDALVSAHGYAFPSGHTIAAAAVAAMLIHLTWRETTSSGWRGASVVLAVPMALVVGFGRVYLGAHYPSDVMASLLEAVAWSCLCIAVDCDRPDLSRTP